MEPDHQHALNISDVDLSVNGHRLAVHRIEPADTPVQDAPALVFLHEGLGSMRLWGDFPHTIAHACGRPAILYDRLGHGRSDPLPSAGVAIDYQEPEVDVFLPAVLSACAVRQSILIGHSDGGTIALLYAARRPAGVLGVVTEAAHVFVEELTREGIRRTAAAFRDTDLRTRLARYHSDIDALFWRWADTWLSDQFAGWNIEAQLKTVTCPVLAIQGDADEYGTAAQMTSIAAHVGGDAATFLVPGCGHAPHYQAREAVKSRIIAFVRSLVSRT
jgi:pimeloyl-ACP methyl ester carboxylesterase